MTDDTEFDGPPSNDMSCRNLVTMAVGPRPRALSRALMSISVLLTNPAR